MGRDYPPVGENVSKSVRRAFAHPRFRFFPLAVSLLALPLGLALAAGADDLFPRFDTDVSAVFKDPARAEAVPAAAGKSVRAAPVAVLSLKPGQTFSGTVNHVSDADTVIVKYRSDIVIRLAAVDAPETAHPEYGKEGQYYGEEAKEFVRGLVEGKKVKVTVETVDDYGRVVGWVALPDGRSLQKEMLSAGWAWWNFYYNHDQELNKLENEALKAGRGLWAGKALGGVYTPEAPWVFRRRIDAGLARILPGAEVQVSVKKASDADTLSLGTRNSVYDYVRLAAVDAPEIPHPGKPGQPYGAESTARAAELVAAEGMNVTVKVEDVDSYGRIIGWVWLPKKNAWLNETLVAEGWAWWYQGYYPGLTELGRKQEAAKAAKLGLWADPNPIPPWDFRASQRP